MLSSDASTSEGSASPLGSSPQPLIVLAPAIRAIVTGSDDDELLAWFELNPDAIDALSARERTEALAILEGKIELTLEQRRKRHSMPLSKAVKGAVADYLRDCLANGDHVQERERSQPAPTDFRALEIVTEALRLGGVSSLHQRAVSNADLDERIEQYRLAGANIDGGPYDCTSDNGRETWRQAAVTLRVAGTILRLLVVGPRSAVDGAA